jgi:hypothetical protein
MTWISKPLRFGGTCDSCGKKIAVREIGWHNAEVKKVRCAECGSPYMPSESESLKEPRHMRADPVGGSAALREAQSRRDPKWLKGATGEYMMDGSLRKRLNEEAIVLTDRRVPGTKSNIDHIVIATSGVWIIDSKKWKGKIEYKAESLTSVNMHLFVGGKDYTSEVESIYGLVIPVAQLIEDRTVPIHAALVFIEGDWSTASLPRFLLGKPYLHEGVYISPPKALVKMINVPGTLDAESISRLANKLDEALKPR